MTMTRPPPETRGACEVRLCVGFRVGALDEWVVFGAVVDGGVDDGVVGALDALLDVKGGRLGSDGALAAADAGAGVSNGLADAEQPATAPATAQTTKASATDSRDNRTEPP
jgi:hypothetical protein